MKYSEIKAMRELMGDDWREIVEGMDNGIDDISTDDWRVIKGDAIDAIQCEELANDEYILGCFNAWFIADVCDIDFSAVKAMQDAEAFEALGKLILSMGKIEEIQSAYVSHDGYGHHFAHYDHDEHEMPLGYLAFRTN